MLKNFKHKVFELARVNGFGKVVGFTFAYFSPVLPLRKVYSSKRVVAFYHPIPSWDDHILIVPKRIYSKLTDFKKSRDYLYLKDIFKAISEIASMKNFYENGFVAVNNSGIKQDVGQFHFHIYTDKNFKMSNHKKDKLVYDLKSLKIFFYANSDYKNFTIEFKGKINSIDDMFSHNDEIIPDLVNGLLELERKFELKNGYSLIIYQYYNSNMPSLAIRINGA
jgi:diadenosine tetraphosphate (Ap4A) HIT family hydrolase